MFLKRLDVRLALFFSLLLAISSLVLSGLTYTTLFSAIRSRDRMEIEHLALEYWARFQLETTEDIIFQLQTEQMATDREDYLLRLADPENSTLFLDLPGEWETFNLAPLFNSRSITSRDFIVLKSRDERYKLEVKTLVLDSGYLVQIGSSTEDRAILQRIFFRVFSTVILFLILISFATGVFLSSRSLRPIRKLNAAIKSIIMTGNVNARIPESDTQDELNALVTAFNTMLERIELLISGMQHTLDNVAHDLRTPLTRFRGVAELALRDGGKNGGDENQSDYKEALSEGLVQSEHILSMLNAILDIAAAESGLMKLTKSEIDLPLLIDEVLEPYSYVAEEKSIHIDKTIEPGLTLECDPGKMRQAVGNLLDNALKYTGDGGTVNIACFSKEPNRACIQITDSGTGIDAADLPHIWDRLYRSRKTWENPGLGLGLSIVKAIVDAHGGTTGVESVPGKGSTFTICITKL